MTPLPDSRWRQRLRRRLRNWYHRSARDLPWRRTRDPYAIWVSEIMLQQTQVVTVIPYFERFLSAFPNVESLAAAQEEHVLRLWEGLGYYRRARQLHRAAQLIMQEHGGEFPTDANTVRGLPGIGRYTAGAILSISLDAREPILEANTLRLLSRWLTYRGDPSSSSGQTLLWRFAEQLLPNKDVGLFNQALMELGSEVCRPRDPDCGHCPVAELCATNRQGLQEVVPRPKKKTRYEEVQHACVIVWRGKQVLLRRCGKDERWSGLWDFPRFPINSRGAQALERELAEQVTRQTGIRIKPGAALATLKHGVTRFRITLCCYQAEYLKGSRRGEDQRWVLPAELKELPLSVTGRKISGIVESLSRQVAAAQRTPGRP